jgi:hypothetical protein
MKPRSTRVHRHCGIIREECDAGKNLDSEHPRGHHVPVPTGRQTAGQEMVGPADISGRRHIEPGLLVRVPVLPVFPRPPDVLEPLPARLTSTGGAAGLSAQAGKVGDQDVVFFTDGGGDLVGEVLLRLAAFFAGVDGSVLTFQHTADNCRFDNLGDLVFRLGR